jgi:adenosylcobinamide-phosphate synthase
MLILPCAFVMDLVFGDPERLPHPVRGIGYLITILDKIMRGGRSAMIEKIKGIVFGIMVVLVSSILIFAVVSLAENINTYFGLAVSILFAYSFIAVKDMKVKAIAVKNALENNDINLARYNLSMIVGRDTAELDEKRIIMAAIESIAESIGDGIVAPIFYLALGGPVLGIGYKSISTLDSMVGYKNEKYKNFGWFSARMDDVVNYIPARIAAFCIVLASFLLHSKYKNSFKILLRDGTCHPSPNSGLTEAAMAGALQIKLGGPSNYNGYISNKAFLGDEIVEPKISNINDAINISYIVSFLVVILGVLLTWLI